MAKIKKVTEELLANVGMKGEFLVVELTKDHHQFDLLVVPKGTRGIITGVALKDVKNKEYSHSAVFVFPHSILKDPIKSFSDGDVRILTDKDSYKAVGRVG